MTFRHQPVKSLRKVALGPHRPWIGAYEKSLRQLGNIDGEAFRLNAIAADYGVHDAVLAMGWFYLNGVGVKPNVPAAIHWYKMAARTGDLSAFFSLGHIAYLERDYARALVWLNRAAKEGHPRSKYLLARMYWSGRGVELDRKHARRLLSEAAAANVVEAQRVERFLKYAGTQGVRPGIETGSHGSQARIRHSSQ
jgi:TPR repeat protein